MITNIRTNWNTRRVGHITVSVQPKTRTPYTILRVESMIDTGFGRPTAILKNALPDAWEIDLDYLQAAAGRRVQTPSLPNQIAHLNCTYTGRSFGVVSDVHETLQALTGNAKIAAIVPDVLRPGDFVIFRHGLEKGRVKFAGVLRAVPDMLSKRKSC